MVIRDTSADVATFILLIMSSASSEILRNRRFFLSTPDLGRIECSLRNAPDGSLTVIDRRASCRGNCQLKRLYWPKSEV